MKFKNILSNGELLEELSKKILDNVYKKHTHIKVSDMKELLTHVDKNLFLNLVGNKLTFDQFKTRVFEKI